MHYKKNKIILFGIIIAVFMIATKIRYDIVNADNKEKIKEIKIKYGSEMENKSVKYKILRPTIKYGYDKEYDEKVYRYSIPIEFFNYQNKSVSLGEMSDIVSEICIYSGGQVWYGNISYSSDEKIKANEKIKKVMVIKVIKDKKIPEEFYEKYKVYNIVKKSNIIYKYRYI